MGLLTKMVGERKCFKATWRPCGTSQGVARRFALKQQKVKEHSVSWISIPTSMVTKVIVHKPRSP